VPSRRDAAERLPASAAVTRIDIDSRRSIICSGIWEGGFHFYGLLTLNGRRHLRLSPVALNQETSS
jgi:hypothetical protein